MDANPRSISTQPHRGKPTKVAAEVRRTRGSRSDSCPLGYLGNRGRPRGAAIRVSRATSLERKSGVVRSGGRVGYIHANCGRSQFPKGEPCPANGVIVTGAGQAIPCCRLPSGPMGLNKVVSDATVSCKTQTLALVLATALVALSSAPFAWGGPAKFRVIHNFGSSKDGEHPSGPLLLDVRGISMVSPEAGRASTVMAWYSS